VRGPLVSRSRLATWPAATTGRPIQQKAERAGQTGIPSLRRGRVGAADHGYGVYGSVARETVLSRDQVGIAWMGMSTVFRADGLPVASRVDYWREIISKVFMPLDLRGEVGPKTPAELRTTEIGPSFTAMRNIRVSVPKAIIPLRDRELGELTGVRIPGDRGAGALASALTRQLARSVDELPAPEAARLGTAVVDVLTVALAGRLDRASAVPGARERTLLHRIYAFVEQQLADPGLSPRRIAAAHHISLRYLHKLFEAEPVTVGGWVRRRRLERCRQDLRDPAQRYRPVAAIGAHWGFLSDAHFSRAFRDEYGVPPAEFRTRVHGPATRVR
jgi:AraC-like DNA-binding protein